MNHEFWMTLGAGIFSAIMSAFSAHYGAKKGSRRD